MHSCAHNWTLQTLNHWINEEYCWFAVHCIVSKIQTDPERDSWQTNRRLKYHAIRFEHHRLFRALDEDGM
jgi:hypothetical protein